MNLPEYGAKVRANSQLVRRRKREILDYEGRHRDYPETFSYWDEKPFDGEVIYLGTRTLQNGIRHFDDEYGYYLQPTEYIKVALVSPSPILNPVYVPIRALIFENPNE